MKNINETRTAEREKITDIVILKEIFNKPRQKSRTREDYRECSVISVVWRVLLICFIIDGGIYFYFHFVKKVTLAEGLRELRASVFRNSAYTDSPSQPPLFPTLASIPPTTQIKQSQPSVVSSAIPERSYTTTPPSTTSVPSSYKNLQEPDDELCSKYKACNVKQLSLTGKVFSWKDKDGKHHFSNANFPIDNETLKVEAEINSNTFYNVTKFIVRDNQILVPVTLSNKGKSLNTHMVLDTGCTHTAAPFHLLDKLGVTYTSNVQSSLADESITNGKRTTIDTLVVGPRRVNNIQITGSKISGSINMGLLGLNFLKENPFKIDFGKQMIVWM